jgi:hypothetical protein
MDLQRDDLEGTLLEDTFTDEGLNKLLKDAIDLLSKAELYETVTTVYQLLLPMYERGRHYSALQQAHEQLATMYGKIHEVRFAQSV